jgi:signal peptidase II
MIIKNVKAHPKIAFSSALILIGAVGNVFDRIFYGFTVDYLIFFGRSALNLSDLLIVLGVVLLLISSRRLSAEHAVNKID